MNKSIIEMNEALARWNAAATELAPHIARLGDEFVRLGEPILEFASQFCIVLRRTQLLLRLRRWMPGRLASWLAERWPEKWLPRLNARGFADATNKEETK